MSTPRKPPEIRTKTVLLILAGTIVLLACLCLCAWYFLRPLSPALLSRIQAVSPERETFRTVDMEQHITTTTYNWGDVPYGTTVCQSVTFNCQGAIRLNGMRAAREGKKYPAAVLGVPVEKRGRCIHLLHAAENWRGMQPGIPYGKILLHYANGEARSFYLQFMVHGMDWFGGPRTPEETVSDPNTRLGWSFQRPDGSYRRFFHTIFPNPFPSEQIVSVDFISPLESANLWIFGMTISDETNMLAAPAPETPALARKLVSLHLTSTNGLPVTNGTVSWRATFRGGAMNFPPFPTDLRGSVILDLPAQGVNDVEVSALAPDDTWYTGWLQRKDLKEFPDVVELKLSAGPAGAAPPVDR